jgi:hypothetical protein
MKCSYGRDVYGGQFCHKPASSYYVHLSGRIWTLCIEHKYDPWQEDILMNSDYAKLNDDEISCMKVMES